MMRFPFRFLPIVALLALACGVPAIVVQPVAEVAANPAPTANAIPQTSPVNAEIIPVADAPPVWGIPHDEIEPQKIVKAMEAAGPDWGVKFLNCLEAWKKTKGKGVVVAVLDTGVDSNHPDLKEAVKAVKDFSGSPFGATDKQGHGSHCAGSVLARGDLPGVAPEAELLGVKVLGDNGSGSVVAIANGIKWAVENGADVISMSLGGPSADNFIPPALKIATDAGVIVIAAAGNEGPGEGTVGYPGRYADCIAVAACDKDRNIARFSSRGPAVFVTGPGVDIRSTYPGGQYATMSGTSMACPHIAGEAALWIAAHPEIPKKERPAKFREALKAACNFTDRTTARGYGVPDAAKLVGENKPGPVEPPAPGKPFSLSITFSDLSAVKQAELKSMGIDKLSLDFGGSAPTPMPSPPSPPIPVIPAPGNCPGGVCPTPGGYYYSEPLFQPFGGFFRRR